MEAGGRGVVVPDLRVAQLVEREIVEGVDSQISLGHWFDSGLEDPLHDLLAQLVDAFGC